MGEPTFVARRPHMPGYGVVGADEGSGLLPWSWADAHLRAAHDFWLATTDASGAPHVMPVWGVWDGAALWFSSSRGSRKARNLERDPRATATTDNAQEPVVVEGSVERVVDADGIAGFLAAMNAKYDVEYEADFLDP
ncbi:MAG: pyridoxamine 5'-phosphate oxidase family protein [Acidimicrobiia bacterium]